MLSQDPREIKKQEHKNPNTRTGNKNMDEEQRARGVK
jgi:hypothetical protein